jgi:hypothetical protein
MDAINQSADSSDAVSGLSKLQRSPRRLTVTLPFALYCALVERSDQEGRSLSNLAAYLLEAALQGPAEAPPAAGQSVPFRPPAAGWERSLG